MSTTDNNTPLPWHEDRDYLTSGPLDQAAPETTPVEPKPRRNGWKAAALSLAVLVAVGGLGAGAYAAGARSMKPELHAADAKIERLEGDLDKTQGALDDAQATIAACDTDRASKVFHDAMDVLDEIVTQYSDYLDNDETYFFLDTSTFDVLDGYNGDNSMVEQFDNALASCTSGSGNSI